MPAYTMQDALEAEQRVKEARPITEQQHATRMPRASLGYKQNARRQLSAAPRAIPDRSSCSRRRRQSDRSTRLLLVALQ